ncbi:hypothetical protein WN944_029029 [Citrus x changshan-huyou]|uniref:Uncharacterized protein n=1 Tax=Citrus x changshan-huyou TaxID=2935761 RepID=A0AAP0LNV7_9ROSI
MDHRGKVAGLPPESHWKVIGPPRNVAGKSPDHCRKLPDVAGILPNVAISVLIIKLNVDAATAISRNTAFLGAIIRNFANMIDARKDLRDYWRIVVKNQDMPGESTQGLIPEDQASTVSKTTAYCHTHEDSEHTMEKPDA